MYSSHSQGRRRSSTKSTSTKSSHSGNAPAYITGPEDPGLSFIFIVNKLEVNEDNGGIPPRDQGGRWVPPVFPQGFHRQNAGHVYRWENGRISRLNNYVWHDAVIEADAYNLAAGGIVAHSDGYLLERYGTATVFYANPFLKFLTVPGDASARSLYDNGEIWHPLRFHHTPEPENISIVDHAASHDYLAGNSSRCPWHKQLVPQAYDCPDDNAGESGGLAGSLPILIALVAFSCSTRELDDVLTRHRSWRNRNWVRHDRPTGRREKRGKVVTVYLDPENPQGSTFQTLRYFENIDGDAQRPVFRPGF